MKRLMAVLMAMAMLMSLFTVSLAFEEDAAPAADTAAVAEEAPAAEETPAAEEETPAVAEEETTTEKQEVKVLAESYYPYTPLYPEDAFTIKKFKDKRWHLVANENSTQTIYETGVFQNEYGWYYVENGIVNFKFTGLASGTYTLEEKTVPAGYNKAETIPPITIVANDYNASNLVQTADVENESGTVLPSTGGIGTTIFYILGASLVIVAAVFLIANRRTKVNTDA